MDWEAFLFVSIMNRGLSRFLYLAENFAGNAVSITASTVSCFNLAIISFL